MAKKKQKPRFDHGLQQETVYGIIAIILFVISIFFITAALGNAGVVGDFIFKVGSIVLGVGYYLLPILTLILAFAFFRAIHHALFGLTKGIASVFFLIAGLGLIELFANNQGGIVGALTAAPLVQLFETYVAGIILVAVFIISIIVLFEVRLSDMMARAKERREERRLAREDADEDEDDLHIDLPEEVEEETEEEDVEDEEYEDLEDADDTEAEIEPEAPKKKKGLFGLGGSNNEPELGFAPIANEHTGEPYQPPPLSLLQKDRGKPRSGDVKANANIIKRTLANFGIDTEIEEVTVGPSVTQFAIKPAEGVRLAKILSLQNNLELALAAHPVRIEAPIPGKSLVGIEIPNSTKTTVSIGSLMESKEFNGFKKPLPFALGKDVAGKTHVVSIAKMPHVLIAGATGAGKSVTIHALVTSLLYKNGPEHLRLVMIDPKRVELTLYKDIPHLLTPVITDPKKAIIALKWLVKEMERRYDVLQGHQVRDISSYHETILNPALEHPEEGEEMPETMPYIVVIIDELADIMSTYPRELEAGIVRLAQMSRAVGIHLVLSTQRPSVNVVTGLIKANVPSRIALQVASQVDSKTILDMAGAEKLLGAGDMLTLSGEMSKPVRIQSGFISEEEVKRVAKYLRKQYGESFDDMDIDLADEELGGSSGGGFDDDDGDDLYEDARATVIEAGKASTSYLQRKLRVGYSRAARLMDMLEDRGVIGPADGSKPREILMESPDDGYDEIE